MTQKARNLRARAVGVATGVLVIFALGLQLRVAWQAWARTTPASGARVELQVQEKRFAGVRAAIQGKVLADQIPPGVIVGYDAGVPAWGLWPWEREYFRAQYMLAPTPLQFETGPWLVVLNYPCDAALREAVAAGRYSLLWPGEADFPHEGERGEERGVALAIALRRSP